MAIADHARMLETLLSHLPGMVYRCRNDPEWTMTFVSEGALELTGYAPADLIAGARVTFASLMVPEDRARVWDAVQAAIAKREIFELRYRITTATGAEKWLWERGRGIFGADGQLEHIEGFISDITERECMEQALRESEEKFAKAFRSSPDSLTITELPSGRYIDVNAGFERVTGYTRDEVIGRTSIEIGIWANLEDRENLLRRVQQHRTVRDLELTFLTRAGGRVVTRCSADIIEVGGKTCLLTVIRDISEERRAEERRAELELQLRQTQKLEALGQLAGGIAHDFNNILTGIMAYAELAALDAERPAQVRQHLAAVKLASTRAGDLVRQILMFSRRQAPERKPTKLYPAIREALKLLSSTLPKTIEIVAELDELAPVVLVDATQIHQVVMNLCTNAAHAMKARAGRLTVQLSLFEPGVSEGFAPLGVGQGRHARLTITDTGCGMDEATLGRVFEPFFTTKEPGEGTGLGLAVVHGIVEEHDGVIRVRSTPDVGTTFDLYFPEFTALSEHGVAIEAPLPRGQGQHVLFVDDEEVIGRAVAQLLERLGYRVTVHTDPREAWRAFEANPAAFDLVVTDLTMPGWTGVELARRILARRPNLPIVLATGHSGTWSPFGVQALGIRSMIHKPLTSATLANELHAILSSAK